MEIIVNGEKQTLGQDMTLGQYLQANGYNLLRVAVERNGDIVSRQSYDSCVLEPGDRLEIVSFVGGG